MATKKAAKKAAKKTAKKSSRQAQLQREKIADVAEHNQAAQAENEKKRLEREAAAREQASAQQAADESLKENDLVLLDVEGVPEAMRTAPMIESIRGLTMAGMHNRAGRIQAFEDAPEGRVAIVNGPDYVQRVPVIMLKRADAVGEAGGKKKRPSRKKK